MDKSLKDITKQELLKGDYELNTSFKEFGKHESAIRINDFTMEIKFNK